MSGENGKLPEDRETGRADECERLLIIIIIQTITF